MKYKFLIPIILFITPTSLKASPEDLYLQAKKFKNQSVNQLSLGYDTVNDTVDIFNLRESEGIFNDNGDYSGFYISANYQLNPYWQIEGAYRYREIEYSTDTNTIHSPFIALKYIPNLNLSQRDDLMFRLSFWGNQSDALTKTSPTDINQYRLSNVSVNKPQDLQIQLDTAFTHKIDPMNLINAIINIGYSEVKVKDLKFKTYKNNCLMDIYVQSNNKYNGKLSQNCMIDNLTINEMSAYGNAEDFGLNIQKDLNYSSYYAGIGGSWNLRIQKFESQLGYQYQRLWRKDIDNRVANFGNNPIKDNHTLGLKLNYDVHPKATVFLKGELYQNNFIATIPFLYNGVTASRLDKRYGLASVGLTFHAF